MKDYMPTVVSVIVMVLGIAWAGGIRDQRISNMEMTYMDLKTEVVKLRDAVQTLTTTIARQEQRINDQDELRTGRH